MKSPLTLPWVNFSNTRIFQATVTIQNTAFILCLMFITNVCDRFCYFKQNDVLPNQFYHIVIDINENEVPTASHKHYNEMMLDETTLFEDLV